LINVSLLINKTSIGFNIIDRIIFTSEQEDWQSIMSRFDLWKLAIKLSLSFPLFGVGLGNFFDYVPAKEKLTLYTLRNIALRKSMSPVFQNPHNIFFSFLSEAGVLSALIIFIMFFYFLINDAICLIKIRNYLLKSIIISFWTLSIFAFLNPSNSIKFYIFFWLFRVTIDKTKQENL